MFIIDINEYKFHNLIIYIIYNINSGDDVYRYGSKY